MCYDSEGSKTLLQDYMYAAELRARGMDVKQVHIQAPYAFRLLVAPPELKFFLHSVAMHSEKFAA